MKTKLKDFIHRNMAWVLLLLICIIFSATSDNFFTVRNVLNILNQNSYLLIAGFGIVFIMMSGQIDLSTGYGISLIGVVTMTLAVRFQWGAVLTVVFALAFSVLLSLLNMILSHLLNLEMLMVTIGTMTIFQGIAYITTQSRTISGFPASFKLIGQGKIGMVPIPVILMAVLFIIINFILNHTYIGRYVFALGGNKEATRLAGVNIFALRVFIAVMAGLMVGLSTVILCARTGSVQATSAVGTEFTIITAILLGGVSVRGGEGKLSGVVAGILILGILGNGMQLANLDVYWQFAAKGVIMLMALGIDNYQLARRQIVKKNANVNENETIPASKITAH